MMLQITICVLAVAVLFLISSIKYFSRQLFLLAIMNAAFIVQAAHFIFERPAGHDNYAVLVNASFGILYFPCFFICYALLSRNEIAIRKAIVIMAFAAAGFIFLYVKFFIFRSMEVISYANVIWHIEVVSFVVGLQKLLSLKGSDGNRTVWRSHLRMLVIMWLLVLTPWCASVLYYAIPADNFLFSYNYALGSDDFSRWMTSIMMIVYVVAALRHKKILETEGRFSRFSHEVKDLVF